MIHLPQIITFITTIYIKYYKLRKTKAKCIPFFLIPESIEWVNTRQITFSKNSELWKEPTSLKSNLICTRQFVRQVSNSLKVGKLQANFKLLNLFLSVLYHFNQNQHRFPKHSFSLQKSTAVTVSDTAPANAPASPLNLQPELLKQRLEVLSTSTAPQPQTQLLH